MKKNFLMSKTPGLILLKSGLAVFGVASKNELVVGFGVVVKKKASLISLLSSSLGCLGSLGATKVSVSSMMSSKLENRNLDDVICGLVVVVKAGFGLVMMGLNPNSRSGVLVVSSDGLIVFMNLGPG